jgi:hypothetical protein
MLNFPESVKSALPIDQLRHRGLVDRNRIFLSTASMRCMLCLKGGELTLGSGACAKVNGSTSVPSHPAYQ